MLVAGMGRMLACLVGRESPGQFDLLRSGGPSEESADKKSGGWWFRFLYALGPFATSLLVFILVWNLLDQPMDFGRDLPRLGFETTAAEKVIKTGRQQLESAWSELGNQKLGDWKMWLFLYCGFALIVPPAPSRDDLVSVATACGSVGLGVFGLAQAGVEVVASRVYGGAFWEGFSFLVAMTLVVLVATLLLLLPLRFLRKDDREK